MSRDIKKKKRSTSKYRKFKISPLIPLIAVIEVIVLIVISTYAWFIVAQEKNARTGVINVDADSGLSIDFKNANYDDEINLWDYVAEDFKFSPVTSLDGRNVFVPTSGTFGNDTTNNIIYRDATVNDINTKYIDVDFTLTNTNNQDVSVYLNNNSSFEVYDGNNRQNSRALRLAFYTNDAKHGNVASSILENTNDENVRLDRLSNTVTLYFNKPSHWDYCYAYVWKTINGTDYMAVSWPGSLMTHVAGTIYSYSFSNTENYTNVVFSNGEDNPVAYEENGNENNYDECTKTVDLTIANGHLYHASGDGGTYTTQTVYFRKPSDWSKVSAHAFKESGDYHSFTEWPGDLCTNCGADIYSYTFPVHFDDYDINGIQFNDGTNNHKTADLELLDNSGNRKDGHLFYFNSQGNGACDSIVYSTSTVYLNNYLGWTKPYVKLKIDNNTITRVAMTNLSAGVFYATVPSVYTQVSFEERAGLDNLSVNQTTKYKYTQEITYTDGHIYRPNTWTNTGYDLTDLSYTETVGIVGGNANDSYAVISPGVSAGFQRAYTPVVGVNSATGAPIQVVPAFASSLDNYIRRSGRAMFTIPAYGMLDLSMIIWLEGTDSDCTNENYAAKNIDLYLEFSTTLKQREGVDDAEYYTYRFYDETRECWTSDRLTNAAGVSVAPVMQLYDATKNRGYLMHAVSTTNIGGTRKIDVWECQAPATLCTGTDNKVNNVNTAHDLYFRRVDPYNEDEVWNYWHPVSVAECNGKAYESYQVTENGQTVTKNYVNFTAFADGAPASTAESGISGNDQPLSAATSASTPARSCGGLWGKYETKLLTAIDGTDGMYLKNDKGVMTINYTFKYGSNKTQTIEYKASCVFNQIYYFVVPVDLKDNGTNAASGFTFKRFYNFNSEYAMNIKNRNATMTYDSTSLFSISGALTGYYSMWNKIGSNRWSYFGNDLLYVNISYTNDSSNANMFDGNSIKYRVHFWDNSNHDTNQYLFTNNGSFQLKNFNGYLVVKPYGYNNFQLQRCDTSNSWSICNSGKDVSYDQTYDSNKHNVVVHYWTGNSNKTVGLTYNNDQVGYGWPVVPAYYY